MSSKLQSTLSGSGQPKSSIELTTLPTASTPPVGLGFDSSTSRDQIQQASSAGARLGSSSGPRLPDTPPLTPEEDGRSPLDEATVGPTGEPTSNASLSKLKGVTVIVTLAGMSFLNTMGSGILISALPRIAEEVGLDEGFLLWPASVYALAAGCLLLIFGAVADVVGAKLVWVIGSFLYVAFTLAVAFSQTGFQIVLFRTFLGISISMCLPTAVSLITNTFAKGSWCNVAFACNGMGQPLGYSLGLILGGIFTDTIGWRWSYYMSAIINIGIATAAIWVLPSVYRPSEKKWTRRLIDDIDWTGACVLSAALGLLLYVLAVTTSSYKKLSDVQNIVLLSVSVVLLTAFPLWMEFQVRRGKPAIIPNKLWRNTPFTATCVAVFFCWASLNAIEYFTTLYFQRVLHLSALQSSIRFLPHVLMGVTVNILTGYLISRVKVQTLAVVSGLITMIAPPLMATVDIDSSYCTLHRVQPGHLKCLRPRHPVVGWRRLFNEVAQFGNAVGLAVTAAIAASITEHSDTQDHVDALMQGYRAAFWTVFAATGLVVVIAFFGLKKAGTVGKKDD